MSEVPYRRPSSRRTMVGDKSIADKKIRNEIVGRLGRDSANNDRAEFVLTDGTWSVILSLGKGPSVRKLELYIKKYGPVVGPKLYHALQSQAAHAGVSARLRRKIDVLTGREPQPQPRRESGPLPLFPEPRSEAVDRTEPELVGVA